MSRHRLRVWVLATLVIAFTAVSAIVFAEWLATGTGQGNAIAGDAVELRVEPTSNLGNGSDTMRLLPGGTGDLQVVIYNDNLFDVEVREISQDGPITSDIAGCDGTTGEVTYATQTGLWVVPAQDQLGAKLVDALAMGVDSANECQGAEFSVPVAVTGGSAVGGAAPSSTTIVSTQLSGIPSSHDFGTVSQFGLSTGLVVDLEVIGGGVTITGASIIGDSVGNWTFVALVGGTFSLVDGYHEDAYELYFQPTSTGPMTATFRIESDASSGVTDIELSGTGVFP